MSASGFCSFRAPTRRRGSRSGKRRPNSVAIAAHLYAAAALLILLVVYGAFAVATQINIGTRHILPMYGPLLILAGCNARWLTSGARWARWGILALAGSTTVSAAAAFPHYLAYFHLAAGGPARGYRLLVDSSLDWGQDLPTLRRWLDRHQHPDEPTYLAYFGTGHPETYGLDAHQLFMHFDWGQRKIPPLHAGLYCISATLLNNVYSPFFGPWCVRFGRLCASLRQREPDADAGHSILIYRLTDEEIARALDGPPAELKPDAVPVPHPLN